MKFKDQLLLEEAYFTVQQSQFVAWSYKNSKLKNIFSEDIWNSNSLEAKLMFVEAFSIGQRCNILEEGVLSSIGKAVLTPIQIVGKIYTSVTKPIGEFVNKYGYEKTGLKEIDEKTFNSVVSKFNQYIDKLNPQAASFIKKSLSEAQTFVKGNPIKMALLAVALTTAMSFAGAPLLSIFAAACLVRGTLGLLKGEKPIQAFSKSLITGTIGKVLGLAGREVFEYFGGGEVPETSEDGSKFVDKSDAADMSEVDAIVGTNAKEELIYAKMTKALNLGDQNVNHWRRLLDIVSAEEHLPSREVNDAFKAELANSVDLNKPVTLRALITNAWKKLGMEEENINKLIKKSFKHKDFTHFEDEALDKELYFLTGRDLMELKPSSYLETIRNIYITAKNDAFKNAMLTKMEPVNNLNNFLEKQIGINNFLQDNLSDDLANNLDKQINADKDLELTFRKLKSELYKHLTGGETGANTNGFVIGNSDYIFYNPGKINVETLVSQILPHEGTHTVQSFDANPSPGYDPQWDQSAKNSNSLKYIFSTEEAEAFTGNLKRLFYRDTGLVLDDENFNEKYNQFKTWLRDFKPTTSNEYQGKFEKNLKYIGTQYIKEYEKNPEKFNFKGILQNVAMSNPSKNVSNIA